MIYQTYNEPNDIVTVYLDEKCQLRHLLDFIDSLINSSNHSSNDLRILMAIKKNSLEISMDELHTLWESSEKLLAEFDNVRVALLIDNPYLTAIAILYQSIVDNPHYQIKVFSTEPAALNWLIIR